MSTYPFHKVYTVYNTYERKQHVVKSPCEIIYNIIIIYTQCTYTRYPKVKIAVMSLCISSDLGPIGVVLKPFVDLLQACRLLAPGGLFLCASSSGLNLEGKSGQPSGERNLFEAIPVVIKD